MSGQQLYLQRDFDVQKQSSLMLNLWVLTSCQTKSSWVMGEDLKNKCSAALPTLHGCKVLRIHGKRGSCLELSGILVSSGITCPTSNHPASPSVAAPAVSSLPRGGQKCSVLPLALAGRACRGRGVMCSLGTLRHIPFTGKRELPNLLGCEIPWNL